MAFKVDDQLIGQAGDEARRVWSRCYVDRRMGHHNHALGGAVLCNRKKCPVATDASSVEASSRSRQEGHEKRSVFF